MNINVSNYGVIELFGTEIWITETIVNSWIIMIALFLIAIIVRLTLNKKETIPSGIQNAAEFVVEGFDNFVRGIVGPDLDFIAPWFFAVAMFLIGSVLVSVLGLRAPAADWTTTFALSLCTFIMMIVLGVVSRGLGGYIKTLTVPAWPFLPINLIGELAKPISLSFRLFGNMLSGTMIINMYNALTPWIASIGVPAILHLIFDVFFGVLHTYIFVIISLSYISGAARD